jgi:glycosyltransferase involved in cell wall biosynthesis
MECRIVHDNKTGLLFDPEDPQGLSAALVRLHRDGDLRQRLAAQGRQWAIREYNWETIARLYLRLIDASEAA